MAQFVEQHRPPPSLRHEVDLAFRMSGQCVEIFEIRPLWRDRSRAHEHPVAKATYVKATYVKAGLTWKVFCHRADMKWHPDEPVPTVASLEAFLALVAADEHACFPG